MGKGDPRREALFEAAEQIKRKAATTKDKGFRVVITGKGGAGKTTLTALLAKLLKREGLNVLAVDEDPQINLPYALGIPPEQEIIPVSRNIDYVEEKTGARPGEAWGVMLTLNPDVSDVVDRFGLRTQDGINLLVMGSVVQAATGCLCPENALLDAIVRYISLREGEVILMDTQAGVEHFGRALAQGFSQAIIITEPSFNALQVALHSAKLAGELEIPHIYLAVNKVRTPQDREKIYRLGGEKLKQFEEIFFLPYDERVLSTEPDVSPLIGTDSPYVKEAARIKEALLQRA